MILRGPKHQICQKMLKGWRVVASNSGGEICSFTKLWKCEREVSAKISAKQDLGEVLSQLEKRNIFLKGSLFAQKFSCFFHCNC